MTKKHQLHSDFEHVLEASRHGDSSSLEWLWEQYSGQILGFLLARGTPEPHEILNDTFLGVFRGVQDFEGGEPDFRAWLFRIARNKRVDALRRQSRYQAAPLDHMSDQVMGGDVEQQAIEVLEDRDLRALLTALTAEQRDVILMRFVFDLSLKQTAVALQLSVGSVKAAQHRALAQLRKKKTFNPYLSATPKAIS